MIRQTLFAAGLILSLPQAHAQVLPLGPAPISYGYFDPAYARAENRQHLGVDLRASAGARVSSPVEGDVVINNTSAADVMQAYMVIRTASGEEHVLGHLSSSLGVGTHVTAGQRIGTVREWPGNSHLHWGKNRKGVAQASKDGWGWGRAPAAATRAQATSRGWVSP